MLDVGADEEVARALATLEDTEGTLAAVMRAVRLDVSRPKDAPPDPDLAILAGDPLYVALLERMTASVRDAEEAPASGR